jgi:hypothetical protein
MNERRKFRRYSFEGELEIQRRDRTVRGRVLEVGADAMFVEIFHPFLNGLKTDTA